LRIGLRIGNVADGPAPGSGMPGHWRTSWKLDAAPGTGRLPRGPGSPW